MTRKLLLKKPRHNSVLLLKNKFGPYWICGKIKNYRQGSASTWTDSSLKLLFKILIHYSRTKPQSHEGYSMQEENMMARRKSSSLFFSSQLSRAETIPFGKVSFVWLFPQSFSFLSLCDLVTLWDNIFSDFVSFSAPCCRGLSWLDLHWPGIFSFPRRKLRF